MSQGFETARCSVRQLCPASRGLAGLWRPPLPELLRGGASFGDRASDRDSFFDDGGEVLDFDDVVFLGREPLRFLLDLTRPIERHRSAARNKRILARFLVGFARAFERGIAHGGAAGCERAEKRK
jgi:hypothetical protein